jgi:Mg2+-importing ATPase
VKIVTGDNPKVATKVCGDLAVATAGTLTGAQVEAMEDDALSESLARTTIFAWVNPEQKARIIRVQRQTGRSWGTG